MVCAIFEYAAISLNNYYYVFDCVSDDIRNMDIKCDGKILGEDPRTVVIDEYVGTWIPLLIAPSGENTWWVALLGFGLFRIIDIYKPLGCRKVEEICPGGYGVMFDDVLAGTYALIVLWLVKLLFLS